MWSSIGTGTSSTGPGLFGGPPPGAGGPWAIVDTILKKKAVMNKIGFFIIRYSNGAQLIYKFKAFKSTNSCFYQINLTNQLNYMYLRLTHKNGLNWK